MRRLWNQDHERAWAKKFKKRVRELFKLEPALVAKIKENLK